MVKIRPFQAWRPTVEKAKKIISLPYDVVNTEEARTLAEGNPVSFLHVIRPEIDLPEDTNIYADDVYEQGKQNLQKLLDSDAYLQEEGSSLYLYQLTWKERSQTGVFCCVPTTDYDNNIILKHELTRPDKENDRTKHILTQSAHAEPVMMTFDDQSGLTGLMEKEMSNLPIYDLETDDQVKHTIWKVNDTASFITGFSKVDALFIADGHHRCASASRVAQELKKDDSNTDEEYNFFPAVLFPMDQMDILAYNRIVYKLNNGFLEKLSSQLELNETTNPIPEKKGDICLYLDGKWYSATLPESQNNEVSAQLDVARLQEFILEPFLGINDQRTDKNLNFVGGIRGTNELESLVDSGKAELAISMYPTNIQELVDVSNAGLLMPPKSTWFEPKLRSGFLVHTF